MYARIIQGRVAELFDEMPTLGQAECALIVECAEGSQIGWDFVGGEVVEPSADDLLDAAITAISADFARRRLLLQSDALFILTSDGPTMSGDLTEIYAKWLELADLENAAINALFE